MDSLSPLDALHRALHLIMRPAAESKSDAEGWRVAGKQNGVSVALGRLTQAEADALIAQGWARLRQGGSRPVLVVTEEGRRAAGAGAGRIVDAEIDVGPGLRGKVRLDSGESPLAWLARRRNANGTPMLPAEHFAAGERLRADFTRAGLSPRMSADWSGLPSSGARGRSAMVEAEATTAARQRFRRALDATGREFSGILVDVCCFLKPLDAVEKERGWPARSAKVVLGLGLGRLAGHYGLDRTARGAPSAGIRVWTSDQA